MPIKIWGLTGFSGSGKTSALKYLADEGYPVCNSDELAAEVMDPMTQEGQDNIKELEKLLGPKAILNGNLPNRNYLRKIITENLPEREIFESWVFPKIISKFEAIKDEWEKGEHTFGFIEGSRLVESGYVSNLSGLIVVNAHRDIRKKRLISGRGLTPEEADVFLNTQDISAAERQADFTWDNSMTVKDLHSQIEVFLMVTDPDS